MVESLPSPGLSPILYIVRLNFELEVSLFTL